ncbi:MAG: ABC-2 family transporter protein [Chlamydiales bacterium]|nr:ABC-2 family transporter protein [Chlamydiales bacterium]
MQHRASFLMSTFALFISTFIEISGIWVLFDRFKMVQGWTLAEVAIIYGTIHIGFAIAECIARGFDTFHRMVRAGTFDRILLRPCSIILQVASREIHLMRLGRLLQGLTVLCWGFITLELPWTAFFIILFAIFGTVIFFYALFVIQAALSFWTIETLELMNVLTYGSVESGQYPMSLYKQGFQWFFTFLVPLACVGYYPIATMLHKGTLPFWLGVSTPLAGVLFLFLSLQFWKMGVWHYKSTGN